MHRTTHPGRASSVDDDDAPDAVVTQRLHDARDFIRRLRRHAPTNERKRTRQSRARAFDSIRGTIRVIESNLDDGVMMSRAVRMASTRAREREKKKVRRVREVGRAFGASRGSMTRRRARTRACIHACIRARASSRMSVWYRTYMGV